jgi:hypothetical protein
MLVRSRAGGDLAPVAFAIGSTQVPSAAAAASDATSIMRHAQGRTHVKMVNTVLGRRDSGVQEAMHALPALGAVVQNEQGTFRSNRVRAA